MIEAYLLEYLYSQKALPVYGMGVLKLDEKEASYDVTTNQYLPPTQHMIWQAQAEESLQPLMRHLAVASSGTEEEAFDWYHSWVTAIRQQLHEKGNVAWPGVGTFTSGEVIGFESWVLPAELVPAAVTANRVAQPMQQIRRTTGPSLVAEDPLDDVEPESLPPGHFRWMIGALILLVIGVTLIALRAFEVW